MRRDDIVLAAAEVLDNIQKHGHQRHFAYAGVSAAYHSDEGASAEWISRFCDGYFLVSDSGPATASIYSTRDATLFGALQRFASQRRSAGENEYAATSLTDSVALVATKATKVSPEEDVYRLLLRDQRTILLVSSGNREVRREQGMQAVRSVIKWLLVEKGWIPMHSACVAKDGRAICVTGEKASGKTSTLLNLLARNGCDLVAIDKFLLREHAGQLHALGLPGKIGIRIGSAAVQTEVLDWLATEPHPFFPHVAAENVERIAATNSPEELRQRKEKLHMLPTELTHLLGAGITPAAPLSLLLIPVFDLDIDESRLVSADREQSSRALMGSYVALSSKGEGFLTHFFDLSDAVLNERLAALVRRYVAHVRAYEVHQNHRTNEQTARLVAGLLK